MLDHYASKHQNLIELGLTLQTNARAGNVEATIKDTLLTQVALFIITNKAQVKRFQIDHDNEVYEQALKEL